MAVLNIRYDGDEIQRKEMQRSERGWMTDPEILNDMFQIHK